jgi:hypothetical protein
MEVKLGIKRKKEALLRWRNGEYREAVRRVLILRYGKP